MENLATKYYLKAKDRYPYDLEEVVESLNYALSYDEEHAAAHSLMGRFYMEQVSDYQEAFYHYEQALIFDIDFVDTYYHYSKALIMYGDFDTARELLRYAQKIKGICTSCILQRKALLSEREGKLLKAKKMLDKAILRSIDNDEIDFLERELKRIKNKIKK